jgi:O-antigen/teichoic acid export membrane protein
MSVSANSSVDLAQDKVAPIRREAILDRQARFFQTDHLLEDVHGRAFRGGLATLLAQAIKLVLLVGSAAVLGRLLLPRDFGLIAMVATVTHFIALFKDLGLSNATIQRPHVTHGQISALFWINCALGLGVAIIIASLSPLIAWFYQEPKLLWLSVALSVNFIFSGLTVQHQALLRRQMRFKATAMISVLSMAAGVTTAIVMASFGFRYWSLAGSEIATSVVNCALAWASCRWRPGLFDRNAGVGPMLSFGGHLTGFTVLNYFTRNFDNILVGRVLGPAALGIYARAYGLLMLPISQINVPLAAVLLPGLSRLHNNPPEYRKLFLRAVGAMSFVTVPLVVFSTFFARDVILVWLGSRWLPVARVFQLLSPAAAVGAMVFAPNWLSQSLGRPAQQLRYALVSAPVCIAGFVMGIQWGIQGVAASFSITFFGLLWGYVWYATKNSPVRFSDVLMSFLSALLPACAAGLVVWNMRWMVLSHASAPSVLIVCGPAFALLFFSIAMLSRTNRSLIFGATRALLQLAFRRG